MDDNKLNTDNIFKHNNRKSGFSIASFVLPLIPITILLIGFLFCFIISEGSISDNDGGAVWWLFLAMIFILVPVTIITDILSIIFGIIGVKSKKTVFGWVGIIIASLEFLAVLLIWILLL